nr:hypothetical protein [Metabacillus fastidiosus]
MIRRPEIFVYRILYGYSGRNKKMIEEYIRNQIQDDIVAEQLSMIEYLDPFKEEEVREKKWK